MNVLNYIFLRLSSNSRQWIRMMGSSLIDNVQFRDAFILVGQVGLEQKQAIEFVSLHEITKWQIITEEKINNNMGHLFWNKIWISLIHKHLLTNLALCEQIVNDMGLVLWCLMPLSTIFQLYQFYWWRKPEHRGKKHQPAPSHWQIWSHNVVSSTHRHERDYALIQTRNISSDMHWLHK